MSAKEILVQPLMRDNSESQIKIATRLVCLLIRDGGKSGSTNHERWQQNSNRDAEETWTWSSIKQNVELYQPTVGESAVH